MKRWILILLLALVAVYPIIAQDDVTPTQEAEPTKAVTQEVLPTVVATQTAVPPIVIENPPQSSEGQATLIILLISQVISYGIIGLMAYGLHGSVSRATVDAFFKGLKGLTNVIPGDTDDKLVDGAEKFVDAVLPITPEPTITISSGGAGGSGGVVSSYTVTPTPTGSDNG